MKRLFASGVSDTVAKAVYAELNSGRFDAAQARAGRSVLPATQKPTGAQATWMSGETWGRDKGMAWKPERPEFSDEMKAELAMQGAGRYQRSA